MDGPLKNKSGKLVKNLKIFYDIAYFLAICYYINTSSFLIGNIGV